MPFHDLVLPAGVNDTFDPESQANVTLRSAKNVDGYDVFRTVSKVPGSSKITSTSMPAQVESIHQYEFTDLAGLRQYKQLANSNGSLYDLIAGTPTAIWTSPALATEALDAVTINSRIFLSSANQFALETGGIKYDGVNATRWGILAPGQKSTTLWEINSLTGWSPNADTTGSTGTISQFNDGSLGLQKTGTSTGTAAAFRTNWTSFDLTDVGEGLVYFWVYIPPGGLQEIHSNEDAGTGAITLWLGTSGLVNVNVYKFYKGNMVAGWNLLSFDPAAPDSTFGAGATLTDVDSIQINIVSQNATFTHTNPFYFDNFFYLEDGSPSVALSIDGNINETVSYRVTYLTEYGIESNGGPASPDISPSNAAATGTVNFPGGIPLDSETVTINGVVYTYKTALTPLENEVLIGGTATTARDNLRSAVNNDGNAGIDYATGTSAHPDVTAANSGANLAITARTAGSAGNSITLAQAATNITVSGATLTGGRDGQAVFLSNIPVSDDAQVIARRIYRDSNADRVYRFLTQINDNFDTTHTDDTPTASLGSATMPIAGDDQLDSSPPPQLAAMTLHDARVFGIDGQNSRIIHVSEPNGPEQFRLIDQLTVDEELVGLRSHPIGLVLYGRQRALLLTGDGVNTPFRVDPLNTELGANNFRSIIDVLGMNVVLKEWEVVHVADPRDAWRLNDPRLDTFRDYSGADLDTAFGVHDRGRSRLLFFVGGDVHAYQYAALGTQQITGDGPGVGPKDLRIGAWWNLTLPITVTSAALIEQSAVAPELWVGGDDGHVYRLQDPAETSYAVGATTAAIDFDIESHPIPLGKQVNGPGEPLYLLLNMDSSTGATLTITVTILSDSDGAELGTASWEETIATGKTAKIVPVPFVGSVGTWCRVRVQNNASGAAFTIRGLRLSYIPRGSFYGTRSA